jgi:hypothetical protein
LWRLVHRADTGSGARRVFTSPAIASSTLVFATYDGELSLLDAGTGIAVFAYQLDLSLRTQPIVARGFI